MAPSSKTLFGFQIIRDCGKGAYGSVYYCQDISQKKLALKVIEKQQLGSGWERELKGITRYRQLSENAPELLKIYHVGDDDQYFYYTMEPADNAGDQEHYIPDTLAWRLKEAPLPTERLLETLRSLLHAINILHEAGYAHRDIKPENILFVHGKPVLADLGLLAPLSGTLTQLAGTLDFLPPEERAGEHSGDSKQSRQRNDLYAFGKLIYCCVTGKNAGDFPSIPSDMPLDLCHKLLFRLCLRLCDKEALRRLNSLPDLIAAFEKVERTCQRGETRYDQISFHVTTILCNISFACKKSVSLIYHHFLFSLIFLATLGGLAWRLWPRPAFDITKIKTKTYTQKELGLEMTIPVEWEVASHATLKKKLDAQKKQDPATLSEKDKKAILALEMSLQQKMECIYCNFNKPFADNITIRTANVPRDILLNTSDEELRLDAMELLSGEMQMGTKIHNVKHLTIAGVPCVFMDISHATGLRVHDYIFGFKDQSIEIALTTRTETFRQVLPAFEAVLTTLKFTKK